ncbi:MAG: HAD-IC family P-type ATPase, partial [Cytophagales bacterium]
MLNNNIKDRDDWHSIDEVVIFNELNSEKSGLSKSEAEERLSQFGLNALPKAKKTTLLEMVIHQVANPLILILVLAAIASILIGEAKDTLFIFVVIFLNTFIGTYQEFVAEKSASSLQNLINFTTRVKRGGKESDISSELVVPGDIVMLESGKKVPADIRLLEVNELEIDESFLTGESIASHKKTGIVEAKMGVPDRKNMAFAGSVVVKGRGKGLVIGTGINTQVGKISQHVALSESGKPPLVQRMEKFIKQI